MGSRQGAGEAMPPYRGVRSVPPLGALSAVSPRPCVCPTHDLCVCWGSPPPSVRPRCLRLWVMPHPWSWIARLSYPLPLLPIVTSVFLDVRLLARRLLRYSILLLPSASATPWRCSCCDPAFTLSSVALRLPLGHSLPFAFGRPMLERAICIFTLLAIPALLYSLLWFALRTPRAGGSEKSHGGWLIVSQGGANGSIPSLVAKGLGAGVIPLCTLPCRWVWHGPDATPSVSRLKLVLSHPWGVAPGWMVVGVGVG